MPNYIQLSINCNDSLITIWVKDLIDLNTFLHYLWKYTHNHYPLEEKPREKVTYSTDNHHRSWLAAVSSEG
jgi:hemerythrin